MPTFFNGLIRARGDQGGDTTTSSPPETTVVTTSAPARPLLKTFAKKLYIKHDGANSYVLTDDPSQAQVFTQSGLPQGGPMPTVNPPAVPFVGSFQLAETLYLPTNTNETLKSGFPKATSVKANLGVENHPVSGSGLAKFFEYTVTYEWEYVTEE